MQQHHIGSTGPNKIHNFSILLEAELGHRVCPNEKRRTGTHGELRNPKVMRALKILKAGNQRRSGRVAPYRNKWVLLVDADLREIHFRAMHNPSAGLATVMSLWIRSGRDGPYPRAGMRAARTSSCKQVKAFQTDHGQT